MGLLSSRLTSSLNVDRQAFPLYLMNFLVNLGVGILAPVLPQLKSEFGVSYGEAGLIVSAFGLSRLVLDLPVGWASERIKPARVLLLGTLLLVSGSVYAGLSSSFLQVVTARAVMGAGSAMCATTALIILSHLSTPENRAKTLSMFPMGAMAGASFSPLIGGYLAALFDWRISFYFCGFTAFSSFLWVALTQRERQGIRTRQTSRGEPAAHHARRRRPEGVSVSSTTAASALIVVNVAVFTVYFSRQGSLQALVPLYSGNVLGLGTEVIGMLMSTSAILSVFALSLSGFLADKYGRMPVFVPGAGCLLVGAMIIPFAQDLTQLMAAVVFLSLGGMTVSIPAVLIGDLSSRESLSRNMGLLRFLTDAGIFAGPVILSSLVDYFGFEVPAFADMGLLVVTTISMLLFLPGSLRSRGALQLEDATGTSKLAESGQTSRKSP